MTPYSLKNSAVSTQIWVKHGQTQTLS